MRKEIKIGVFTVLMIAGAWVGIRFLSGVDVFSRNNDYYIIYDQTNGVQKASAVVINGVKVGNVTDIQLSENRRSVAIKITVPKRYRIPMDSEAKVFSSSLMSSKEIGLTLGAQGYFMESGDTIRSTYEKDFMAVAGSEFESVMAHIDHISTELARALTNINVLLEANANSITNTTQNLDLLITQTSTLMNNNQEQLNQIIEGFALTSQALGDSAPQIDSIFSNINRLTAELNNANVSGTIAQSLEEVNTLLATINDENGSINRLMTDEKLYENLASASGNMDSLFVDLKENPWRYVNFSVIGRNEYKQREKMEKKAERELRKAEK